MVKSQKDVRCCLKIIFYSIFLFTFISVCIESGLVHFTPYYLIKSEIFHKSQSARNIIFLQPETKVFTKPEIILPERIKILNVNKKFVNRFNHFQEKCDEFLNSSSSTPKIFEEGQNILKIANFFPTDRANFDPKHNLLYCFPPKSGTTNWNRLATSLYHEISIKDLIEKYDLDYVYNSLPTLQKLAKMQEDSNEKFSGKSLSDLIDSDNNDIKSAILLSRHPLTRLYSSWGHRFSDVNPSHRIVFRPQIMKIKQKYQEIDDYPQPKGIFVTFSSFLRFLISDEAHDRGQGGLGNVHWLRVIDLCKPCELKNVYNFIVSLETSEEDADIFLSTVESQADNKLNFSQLVGKFPNAYYQDDKSDDKERLNLPNSKGEVPQTKDVGARIDGIKKYYREHVDSDLQIQMTMYQMKQQTRQIGSKLAELKAEKNECSSVIKVLEEQPDDKKAYQMIGAVLTESTVGKVLPNLVLQRNNLEKIVNNLTIQLKDKGDEVRKFTEQYNVGMDNSAEPSVPKTEAKAGGVIV